MAVAWRMRCHCFSSGMVKSHRGRRINEADWTVFVGLTPAPLERFWLVDRKTHDVVATVASLKGEIVDSYSLRFRLSELPATSRINGSVSVLLHPSISLFGDSMTVNTTSPFCLASGSVGARKQPSRRQLLRAGLTGFTSLSLAGLYNLRGQAAAHISKDNTAIILVWCRGGISHLDTFDPKPAAASEFRSPYEPIDTNVSGMQLTELLPRLSKMADRYALLRSVAHTGGGHPAGSLQVLAGDPDARDKTKPILPDFMTVTNYLRRGEPGKLPKYIAVNPVDRYDSFTIAGATHLGASYEAFQVIGDPNKPSFQVPNIGNSLAGPERLKRRLTLKESIDRLNSDADLTLESLDQFQAQAIGLMTSPAAKEAFDLSKEPDQLRERYGRNQWGQQCLMARRLVEAGVELIATEFDGPLCGRVANWDDHAVNHHVFEAIKYRSPFFDQAVSALIEDIYNRGLDKRVLVVVTGEFGRTPRISHVASSGGGVASGAKGTVQPGRDHWPRANTMLFSGGGIRTGQVIGATDPRGEDPVDRRVGPLDFLATLYRHLGIDSARATIPDFAGRPVPILPGGKPIRELS